VSALSCETVRRLAHAYVDGELVGDERAAIEAHVAGCDACRRAQREDEALARAVREAWPSAQAPDALRSRVQAVLRAGEGSGRRAAGRGMALAAILVLAVAGGFALGRRAGTPALPPPARAAGPQALPVDLSAVAADTHLRYIRGQLPLEVDSAEPGEVSRWFEGRVPFNLALPDYPVGPGERKFYHLQGGRLVSVAGDYAAYVAYRMDDRPISLIVTSAALARPEGADTVRFRSLTFHQRAVHGLEVVTWSDKGLTYALASDVSVGGERSCMVCHGSPEERRLIEGFSRPRP
jgi:anti-sigma factor RsiW